MVESVIVFVVPQVVGVFGGEWIKCVCKDLRWFTRASVKECECVKLRVVSFPRHLIHHRENVYSPTTRKDPL